MSKITNDGLTRSDTGCFIAVPSWSRRQTSTRCTSKPDPTNLHHDEDGERPSQEWRRACGRPSTTWTHQICRDTYVTATEALQLAENRPFWRTIATAGGSGWTLRVTMIMMMTHMVGHQRVKQTVNFYRKQLTLLFVVLTRRRIRLAAVAVQISRLAVVDSRVAKSRRKSRVRDRRRERHLATTVGDDTRP